VCATSFTAAPLTDLARHFLAEGYEQRSNNFRQQHIPLLLGLELLSCRILVDSKRRLVPARHGYVSSCLDDDVCADESVGLEIVGQ
jgi:hypothetical protein